MVARWLLRVSAVANACAVRGLAAVDGRATSAHSRLIYGVGGTSDVPVVRALACCVATHPRPVRGVRVTHGSFYAHEYALWCLVAVSQTSPTSGG